MLAVWVVPPTVHPARSLPLDAQRAAREQILTFVRDHPGATMGEAREHVGLSWGAFCYHIARLRVAHRIHVEAAGRRRLLYPSGWLSKQLGTQRALLQGATARRVALAILLDPGCDIRHLMERLDDSPRAIYYHVRKLIDHGLVRSGSGTRHFDLRPTDALRALLDARRVLRERRPGDEGAPRS